MPEELHLAEPSQEENTYPAVLRVIAQVFSFLFHPIFIPLYGTLLIVFAFPFHFANFMGKSWLRIFGTVTINTIILPGVTVLLLKKLGFIKSIYMRTQSDRIIPYVATMIFYFWIFYVFHHQSDIPQMLTAFFMGNFIAIILAFMANIFMKISMHMLGVGGLLGMLCTLAGNHFVNISAPLLAVILLCGIVATCRLILSAHSMRELYWGFIIGVLSQLVAVWLV